MGLYEGESSLYFMIVQRDLDSVKWLLDKDARFHVSADQHYCEKLFLLLLCIKLCVLVKMVDG
jgi:hypothetical protein